ncbi:MAG: Ldh family oxidoreductase [Chloroflexi bacterium]|nr:Ldh family oxidoreductase [Chloroflexota bacterium]
MDVNGHRYGYRINGAELRCFAAAVFEAAGLAPGHAVVVADSLTQAELRGQGSHGVSRLLDIYVKRLRLGVTNPRPCPVTVAQKGGTALVDGDNGPGQVAGVYAMMLAIDLAHEYGVGCVAVRRSNHYGAAAFYLQQALEAGMIGLTTTNAPPNMPPTGGREPFLGTNPLAVAVPSATQGPVLLDMATSVVAKGKIQLMAKEGQQTIPPGWALDAEGHPTTDVQAALGGMMLPVGGHKGYGLALVVEILSALVAGAAFGPHLGTLYADFDRGQNVGHFFAALDPGAFGPGEGFLARMDALLTEVRTVPTQAGVSEILLPGEVESRCQERYAAEGIPFDQAVYEEVCGIAGELGVPPLRAMALDANNI